MPFARATRLDGVFYDIRGPVLNEARRLEEEGHRILNLNVGNPAAFGFEAPEDILRDVVRALPTAQGYSDSKGLLTARRAVVQYYEQKGIRSMNVEDLYLGSEWSSASAVGPTRWRSGGDARRALFGRPTAQPRGPGETQRLSRRTRRRP